MCARRSRARSAAHSCRHIRPAAPRHRSSGWRPGRSRWRRSCHGDLVRDVSFEDARRRRISRTALCESVCKSFMLHLDIEIVKRSIRSADLWSCPNAGSSSRSIACLIAAEGSPKIGRTSTERRSRSCASPQSASCSENSAIRPEVSGQTLSRLERNFTLRKGERSLYETDETYNDMRQLIADAFNALGESRQKNKSKSEDAK